MIWPERHKWNYKSDVKLAWCRPIFGPCSYVFFSFADQSSTRPVVRQIGIELARGETMQGGAQLAMLHQVCARRSNWFQVIGDWTFLWHFRIQPIRSQTWSDCFSCLKCSLPFSTCHHSSLATSSSRSSWFVSCAFIKSQNSSNTIIQCVLAEWWARLHKYRRLTFTSRTSCTKRTLSSFPFWPMPAFTHTVCSVFPTLYSFWSDVMAWGSSSLSTYFLYQSVDEPEWY